MGEQYRFEVVVEEALDLTCGLVCVEAVPLGGRLHLPVVVGEDSVSGDDGLHGGEVVAGVPLGVARDVDDLYAPTVFQHLSMLQTLHLDPFGLLDEGSLVLVRPDLGSRELHRFGKICDVVPVLVGDQDLLYVAPGLANRVQFGLKPVNGGLSHTRVHEDQPLRAVKNPGL